jgi:hypothetical protein
MRARSVIALATVFYVGAQPTSASAQSCTGWNFSFFSDSWYDVANWVEAGYAEGVDYDANCCSHQYYSSATLITETDIETVAVYETRVEFFREIRREEKTLYFYYSIGCPCLNAPVGIDEHWGELPPVTVTLDPAAQDSAIGYGDMIVTASVSPPAFEASFSWGGDGIDNPNNSLQRLVSTESPRVNTVLAYMRDVQVASATATTNGPTLVVDNSTLQRTVCANFYIENVPNNSSIAWQYEVPGFPIITRTTTSGNASCAGSSGADGWAGKMLMSGVARVTITRGGNNVLVNGNPLSVTVSPRQWGWDPVAPIRRVSPFAQPGTTNNLSIPDTLSSTDVEYGLSSVVVPYGTTTGALVNDNGPSNGLRYIQDQLAENDATRLHRFDWVTSRDLFDTTSPFASDQTGSFDNGVSGGCIHRDVLKSNVTEHESGTTVGHYAQYQAALTNPDNNPGLIAEGFVSSSATIVNDMYAEVNDAISRIYTAFLQEPPPTGPVGEPRRDLTGAPRGLVNFLQTLGVNTCVR